MLRKTLVLYPSQPRFHWLACALISALLSLSLPLQAASIEHDPVTGSVTLTEPTTLSGTALATWQRHQLDDDISYRLRLYLVVDRDTLDPAFISALPDHALSDTVTIELNVLNYAAGRLQAIRAIFGDEAYQTITHTVGTYQKSGRFSVQRLMTQVECDHRDVYAEFVRFTPSSDPTRHSAKALDVGCSGAP